MSLNSLYDAIALVRAGKTEDARQVIFEIIRNDPQNEMAWMWLAETLTSEMDRMKVLKSCLKINPNSKIAKMAVSKLQEKFQNTQVDLPPETPFTEGATFDPSMPERTGHTGAIIGFDGSFILDDVADFDDVVDLRSPSMATTKLPTKGAGEEFFTDMDGGLSPDSSGTRDPEDPFSAASDIPTIPLGKRGYEPQELEYEPDLSTLLDEEKSDLGLPPSRTPANRVPLYQESDDLFRLDENDDLTADELGFSDDESEFLPPAEPTFADLLDDNVLEEAVLDDEYQKKANKRERKGRGAVLWVVAAIFLLISVLCVVLFFVLGGNSFLNARAVPQPTALMVPSETMVPTATETLVPTPTNTPEPTFTPTLMPTATALVSISDNAINGLTIGALVMRLKETYTGEFYTNLNGNLVAVSDGRNLQLWDVATGQLKYTLIGHNDLVTDAAFSADNRYLVSAARNFTIILWDLNSGEQVKSFGMDVTAINRIYGDRTRKYPNDVSVDYSPDGSTLAAGAFGVVNIFDIASGVARGTYSLNEEALQRAAEDSQNLFGFIVKFNDNGWVLSAAMSKNLVGLDTLDAAPLYQYELGAKAKVSFGPERLRLVEADSGGLVIRNLVDGAVTSGYGGRTGKPNDAPPAYLFSIDGDLLGIEIESQENSIGLAVWNILSDSNLMNFKGICQASICEMPAFDLFPHSDRIAVARQNNDGSVSLIIVNLFSNQIVYRFDALEKGIRSITVSPNEEVVAALDGNGVLRLWDLNSGEERASIPTDNASQIQFSRNGEYLYAWSLKNIQAWGNP